MPSHQEDINLARTIQIKWHEWWGTWLNRNTYRRWFNRSLLFSSDPRQYLLHIMRRLKRERNPSCEGEMKELVQSFLFQSQSPSPGEAILQIQSLWQRYFSTTLDDRLLLSWKESLNRHHPRADPYVWLLETIRGLIPGDPCRVDMIRDIEAAIGSPQNGESPQNEANPLAVRIRNLLSAFWPDSCPPAVHVENWIRNYQEFIAALRLRNCSSVPVAYYEPESLLDLIAEAHFHRVGEDSLYSHIMTRIQRLKDLVQRGAHNSEDLQIDGPSLEEEFWERIG